MNKSNSRKKILSTILPSILLIFASSSFATVFMYSANAMEISLAETLKFVFLFFSVSLVLSLVFTIFSKNYAASALYTAIFNFAFFNYKYIENGIRALFPSLQYWHVLPIILYLLLVFFIVLYHTLKKTGTLTVVRVLSFTLSALVVLNVAMAIPKEINKANTRKEAEKALSTQRGDVFAQSDIRTNIYWLILDEYAGFSQLKNYFNYDNDVTKDKLEKMGFTVSTTSRNNSTDTNVVLTNMLLLSEKLTTAEGSDLYRQSSPLVNLLRANGYTLRGVGNTEWLGFSQEEANVETKASTEEGQSFFSLLMSKSMAYPLTWTFYGEDQRFILNVFNEMDELSIEPDSATFTTMYITFPHAPFLLDKDGNEIPFKERVNWEDTKYYLGQLEYATKRMMPIVERIIRLDPGAIILLCSDHGARGGSNAPPEEITTILNAVYFKGEPITEINGANGPNTLRTILKKEGLFL